MNAITISNNKLDRIRCMAAGRKLEYQRREYSLANDNKKITSDMKVKADGNDCGVSCLETISPSTLENVYLLSFGAASKK